MKYYWAQEVVFQVLCSSEFYIVTSIIGEFRQSLGVEQTWPFRDNRPLGPIKPDSKMSRPYGLAKE